MHFVAGGFTGILILCICLAYLYEAAHAWKKDRAAAWQHRASTADDRFHKSVENDGGAFHVVSLSADELLVYLANLMDSKN